MNYRHAFHAGNFADVVKHALLVALVRALQRKESPIAVLDTHAGAGRYDLAADPATRTGEWRAGFARLRDDPPPDLADYVVLADADPGHYPGSPLLIRRLLRPQDRLVCCELHPDDHAALAALFARDRQVAVHRRDAWEALGALLPPAERRGLSLIDPPFEAPDEFARLAAGIATARRRFAHGVLAAWYPIKDRAAPRAFHDAIRASGARDVIAAELTLRPPLDATRLNGCGVLVVNPPFGFPDHARAILAAVAERLAPEQGATQVTVLADE